MGLFINLMKTKHEDELLSQLTIFKNRRCSPEVNYDGESEKDPGSNQLCVEPFGSSRLTLPLLMHVPPPLLQLFISHN